MLGCYMDSLIIYYKKHSYMHNVHWLVDSELLAIDIPYRFDYLDVNSARSVKIIGSSDPA